MPNFQSFTWKRAWLLLALLLVCWTIAASAQQIATLPDGRTVVLYDDFSWQYYGQDITYDFDFSKLSPDTIPLFLRQGVQVDVLTQTIAVEMYLQSWRYTMPVPKSAQAMWGNSDGRTTSFYGYWYNIVSEQVSSTRPEKKKNGIYLGDCQDLRKYCGYRKGGTPSFPTDLQWLLSQSGGVKPLKQE